MKRGSLNEMEKRQSFRLEKTLPVKFELADVPKTLAGPFEALSRNIGEGGVFIETDVVQDEDISLGKDMMLNLEIELLGQIRRMKPKGRVIWISKKSRAPQKKRNGIGIKFMQITPEEKRAISIFISKEMLAQSELIEKEIPVILREQKLTDRQRRNLEILDTIRKNRLISRAEISKYTNINIVTISNYVDTYLKKGLVFERGLDISTGGRRPELVEINPRYGYVIGIDLGPLNRKQAAMQVVATDFTSQLRAAASAKRKDENPEESLDILKGLIAEVMASNQIDRKRIRGIGMGIFGIMDKFGGTARNPLTGETVTNYVTIKKGLEDEFGLPVFMENSAVCALFIEKWSGASLEAKDADNIIYMLSDDQCAIMIKGEIYTGSSKSAGQLNFTCPKNNYANSDSRHCWADPAVECILRSRFGDSPLELGTREEAAEIGAKLGAKIAYLVNVFNPQVVIIGRNFSQLGDAFLDAIRRSVNRLAYQESANIARIVPATLGDEAVAQGAASLVIEAVFANI